ncbi:flagellar hook assembly protein FlgD [Erwiniaceae bacterium BAC15a-03b]|uniref:Basal-body rod modification protein FlgD n=1 Tax=Winslowiella arboricola TaxID=2978220 RepID=A0A9J6PZ57_9GAMM|nr:flagellar hook assembly protein FlgD [Winslowiella arboricola]MCU5775407.1 flagellar hook assembly protein FlgD [Winslowiella arboricola]MCU5780196.1 flagellar hook assembly protein FlgD [Winslowiella arboricola]
MSVSVNVNESTALASTSTSSTSSSASDLQSNFLTLLVTQLKNQDPTNPMENSELTTQLAQINTVSGIEKLNTTLSSISGQINSNQALQASSLIGQGVMVDGSQILAGSGVTTPFGVELESASTATTVTIKDSTGAVVRTIDLGAVTAGVHSYTWDGTLEDGSTAPDGKYSFTIAASSGSTQLVAQPLNYGLVNGVTTNTDSAVLDLGTLGTATLSDVRQIL